MAASGSRGKLAALGDRAGFGEAAYARRWEKNAARRERYSSAAARPRGPLTAGQHILHLLLTVFTGGLWAPVWIIRAMQGNKVS